MRYWLYKCNVDGGPAGFWGDWRSMVFNRKGPVGWGGHYSTRSPEVAKHLDNDVTVGDVVVAYQTDEREVVGFCTVVAIKPSRHGGMELRLQPIAVLRKGFRIHDLKAGTPLASSSAVNGRVMLRELEPAEMRVLVSLAGAPARVLRGQTGRSGWVPAATTQTCTGHERGDLVRQGLADHD